MRDRKGMIGIISLVVLSGVLSTYMLLNEETINLTEDLELYRKEPVVLFSINDMIGVPTDIVEKEETLSTAEAHIEEIDLPEEGVLSSEETLEQQKTRVEEKTEQPNNKGMFTENSQSLQGYLNQYVLDTIKIYDIGRTTYPYLLNEDYENYNGVTEDLYYKGNLLLKAHPSGNRANHCSGITFEVFYKAMKQRNRYAGIQPDDFNSMNWEELFDFVLTWYAATGPKKNSNISIAVEKYGVGKSIDRLQDARPGDFIDISRENGTGHTMVFLDWVKEGNKIIGLKYWSSQQSTNGINYNKEYFNVRDGKGNKYGNVMIDRVYIARILPINQYSSF
ncbi:MAG: hypothetical protein JJT76_18645 [Clostridiaceae bacterium]|nr:hypothetical protein [Clostridiaceae bacterium]